MSKSGMTFGCLVTVVYLKQVLGQREFLIPGPKDGRASCTFFVLGQLRRLLVNRGGIPADRMRDALEKLW